MTPLPFVWPYALVFWAVYVWSFSPEWGIIKRAQEGAKSPESKDAGSIRVLFAGVSAAFVVSFALSFLRWFQFPQAAQPTVFWAGLAMLLLGSALRRYCWRALGEYFTGDVKARADQPVIQTGPYHFVRHPSYTAAILMNVGIGLALGSWLGCAILLVASIAVYGYRISVEERALLETIGRPYADYMKARKRLIPYII